MRLLKQVWAVSLMNLRSVPQRWSTSLVIVVGIAGVVGVLTAILAMSLCAALLVIAMFMPLIEIINKLG